MKVSNTIRNSASSLLGDFSYTIALSWPRTHRTTHLPFPLSPLHTIPNNQANKKGKEKEKEKATHLQQHPQPDLPPPPPKNAAQKINSKIRVACLSNLLSHDENSGSLVDAKKGRNVAEDGKRVGGKKIYACVRETRLISTHGWNAVTLFYMQLRPKPMYSRTTHAF
jgi:hypothetical protein